MKTKAGARISRYLLMQLLLLRGIDKVKAEWALICTAHNLVKLARAA